MAHRYSRRILEHLSHRRYEPRTADELIHDLNIPDDEADDFRQAVNELLQEGQLVLGLAQAVTLPPPGREMVGIFRRHERGFGFLVPDDLTEHGDLFIPPNATKDALTGDRVRATVQHEPRRGGAGRSPYTGRIVEILQRAEKQYVGELYRRGDDYFVQVDGRVLHEPVIIRDPHAKDAKVGDKVVIELVDYPDKPGELAEGVIVEVLGEAGEPAIETLSVMRSYGLVEHFPDEVMDQARQSARSFDPDKLPTDREDLRELFICTIDPPDARDFDDAISIHRLEGAPDGAVYELGVHIADVSHFVPVGSTIDAEAYERGNSTYLPRRVLPMLPELLSNGVCSLQERVPRLTKSCFMRFDKDGKVVVQRFSRSIIHSAKRLTYLEAQALIDDDLRAARKHARSEVKYPKELVSTLKLMDELARIIRKRRFKDGMITLSLPEVELVFDDTGRVTDAVPEDDAFTHTIIEMFMVEANEAAARVFHALGVPMVRRVHPDPDAHDLGDLSMYARVAGYNIPAKPSRKQLQELLDSVRGKPAEHAVHLAVLKTLSKAIYAPDPVGHFALASEHYTHFTSPIRRYPDLVVHRGLDGYIKVAGGQPAFVAPEGGGLKKRKQLAKALAANGAVPDEDRLRDIGRHCSNTERNSEQAERELRNYLVLELLSTMEGDDFEGTVTGVTGSGVYIQLDRYLVDGMVRSGDLPGSSGERWQLNPNTGALTAQRSGRSITIGHKFIVRIAGVDLARRQLDLTIIEDPAARKGEGKKKKAEAEAPAGEKRRQVPGARQAEQKTQKLKQTKKGEKRTPRASDKPAAGRGKKKRR